MIWQDLGISAGTAIIVLIALYFVIKWGVASGIKLYFKEKEKSEEMKKIYNETREKMIKDVDK